MGAESDGTWYRILMQINREQAALEGEHPDFDTWMRHRTNVAHAKYMERTSYHLRCDWPAFSPKGIASFVHRYNSREGEH